MRRPPLWTTLIPLAAAMALYHHWWAGQRDAFGAELAAVFGPGIEVGGFPYRLEADVPHPALRRETADALAQLSAARLVLNRQPFGQALLVGRMADPRVELAVPGIAGARADIEAASSKSSLRMADGHVARLSTVFDHAKLFVAALASAATADSFETHFRETPSEARATPDPRFPVQDELVLAADGFRYGGSDPLKLAASLDLTARRSVRALADWRPRGTVEVRRLALSDKTGDVLTMIATLSPDRQGGIAAAGTLDTVCPVSVEAAFARRPAPREFRARHMVRYSFSGPLPRLRLAAVAVTRVPVRNQEPPCPVLRR